MTSMVTTRSGLATALHTEYREKEPLPDSLDSSVQGIPSSLESYSQESYRYSQESHRNSQDDDNEEEASGEKEEEEPKVGGSVRRRLHNRSLTPGKPTSYTHCIKESAGALYKEGFTDDLPIIGSDDDERPIHVHETKNVSEDIDIVKNNIKPISLGGILKLVMLIMSIVVVSGVVFKILEVRRENSRTIKSKVSETLELFADIEKRTILSDKRLEEIKKNILNKILAPLKEDPLSIFILVTEDHWNAIEAEFQTITHIFNKAMKLSSSPTKTISEHSWATNKIYQDNLDTILAGNTHSLIISDFDKFSWPKARLFYQYCDNENAPYNDKLFVFLVTVENCTEGSEVKQIEEMLEKRWFNEEGADIPALVTRVSAISTCVT